MVTDSKRYAVIGIFRSRAAADDCFRALLRRGYLSCDINFMMTDRTRNEQYAVRQAETESVAIDEFGGTAFTARDGHPGSEAGSKAVEGIGVGGTIGTAVGATLAAIAAVGTTLVVPGLNLIIAGPIVAALAGGGAGALTGGLVGGLVGLGIPEQNAVIYNRALQEGGLVMSVETRPDEVQAIKNLMIECSGEEVCCCNH